MVRIARWPWARIALALSLALNLLVAGIVIGAVSQRDRAERAAPFVQDRRLLAMTLVLPGDRRAALRAALHGPRPPAPDIRELQQSLLATIRQDKVSVQDMAAVLADLRAAQGERAAVLERALAAQIAAMPVAERRAYAVRLARLRDSADPRGRAHER